MNLKHDAAKTENEQIRQQKLSLVKIVPEIARMVVMR